MAKRRSSSSKNSALGTLITLIVLLVGGYLVSQGYIQVPGVETATQAAITQPFQPANPGSQPQGMPDWLQVYFPNPNVDDPNTVDQHVVPVINAATQTIDITSFDFNLPSVVDAVVGASKRGVKVRMVLDEKNGNQDLSASDSPTGKDYNALQILKDAGIPVVDGGRSNGLMHNKIIIVDSKTLFMGSWNMSFNDTNRNNNNLLIITDPTLIANYQAKFDELFVDKRFGTHAEVGAMTSSLTAGGVQVENYFSPVDGVMAKLVNYVQGAQTTVHFIIFTYTHDDLAQAMIARAKTGVEVQGVIENRGASQGAFPSLFCAKLPVRTDGNKYTMHHKVIIIDGQYVITGSFNFTVSADEANDDNILIIHNPAVAALYEQEFQRIYSEAVTPQASDVKC
jgi:phosphatidylserine/phosphatidylglycerophosphate/cardiolipin synthase-like enzyme